MKVRIIGCHGSVEPGYRTTCYQVNERFFIDAGSISSGLTPQAQIDVSDVFLTHPHLDHIKDLCFLIENTASSTRAPLFLHSTEAILNDIHDHIFNDVIWPDFSKVVLDDVNQKPILQFAPLPKSLETELSGVKISAFPVNHPGNAIGYLLDDGEVQILFTGDTGPCEKIWQIANSAPRLKAIFTEISLPSRMDGLAQVSGHYRLAQLLEDLRHLKSTSVPVYIAHFKAQFMRELLDEFHQRATPQLKLLHESDEFVFT